MPAIEVADLRQKAVLWRVTGQDRHGMPVLSAPEEIACRWVDDTSQVIDPEGNTIGSSGTVIMGQSIDVMSILWKGALLGLPSPPTNLHQVISRSTTPDIKNRNTRYEYKLMRYSNALPTVQ